MTMDPLTTFIIVLMAGVGICSLRRVWRVMEITKKGHDHDLGTHARWLEQLDNRIAKLESERKD